MAWLRAYWPKVVSGLAIAAVAGVAGVVSYTHIYRLTLTLHQPVMVARLMPIAVDGLVVVGSVVLLQSAPGQRWLGWAGVGPGVAISLFANVESGIGYGALAAAWAGIPAVAFALATFMLERWLKAQVAGAPGAAPEVLPETAPEVTPRPVLEAVPGIQERSPASPDKQPGPVTPERLAEFYAADLAKGRVPSKRRIKREWPVGYETASDLHTQLAATVAAT
jgi:Protein of unknown function (DUF2637)